MPREQIGTITMLYISLYIIHSWTKFTTTQSVTYEINVSFRGFYRFVREKEEIFRNRSQEMALHALLTDNRQQYASSH